MNKLISTRYILLALLLAVFLFASCNVGEDPNFTYITSYDVVGGWHSASALDGELDKISSFNDKLIQNATKYSVQLFKVRYRTTYKSQTITASGIVLVPTSTLTPLPILSYHHGTRFYDGEVPSMTTAFDLQTEVGWAYIMASTGFVCAMPDYIGFAESWDIMHPYLDETASATAAIDFLRATKELCAYINVAIKKQYFLAGYSEGGYVTMAVQKKIQASHAAEFPLAAVSAGAGPYDLRTTADILFTNRTNVVPAYAPYLFVGYNSANGWNRPTSDIFNEPYATRIDAGLFDGAHDMDEINSQLNIYTTNMFKGSFLNDFTNSGETTLKTALSDNSVYAGWAPTAPTRIYHGTLDLTVPYTNALIISNAFQGMGGNFTVHTYAGYNHVSAGIPYSKDTLLWFLSLQ